MNRYGVDDDYFRKKLESVIASLYNYTPEELSRELQRLANTASKANQPAQPAGWKLVPVIADKNMSASGNRVLDGQARSARSRTDSIIVEAKG